MATAIKSNPPQEEDWDDYLRGMFKKLKMDPDQLKGKTKRTEESSKKSTHWYTQPIRTPTKTRKSLALRNARSRPSPYKTSLPCHGAKLICESSTVQSGSITPASEKVTCEFKVCSDFGKVQGKFTLGGETCSCLKKSPNCKCEKTVDEKRCNCGQVVHNCQFGSSCKSKLVTFRTLATIVEETGEASTKEEAERKSDSSSCNASKPIATAMERSAHGAKSCTTAMYMNYRENDANHLPGNTMTSAAPQCQSILPLHDSHDYQGVVTRPLRASGHSDSRIMVRPEYSSYSCSQEARMAEDGLLDDTSVDDLAGYFDSIVYIPRKMSAMAEMMYT